MRVKMKDFQNCRYFQKEHSVLNGGLVSCDVYGNILDIHCIEACQGSPKDKITIKRPLKMNIKKKIKKFFARNKPPYYQDTKAWRIILAENERLKLELEDLQEAMSCKECVNLTIKNRLLLRDKRKLIEALNECYSTIAALEKGNEQLKRDKDFCERERQAGITKIQELERERKMPRYIGLQDRNGEDIYAGCKFKCKCRPGNGELTGIIKWGKFKAGYTLRDLDNDSSIAAFRQPAAFGVMEIKEMPDGRIDGIIIKE